MAKYGTVRAGSRIFLLILVILVLMVIGLVLFDWFGLINARSVTTPVLQMVGYDRSNVPMEETAGPGLLEDQRIMKLQRALDLREEELVLRDESISQKEAELAQMLEEVAEREKALAEKEKTFNDRLKEYENRNVNLRQVSEYLVGMPPDSAVKRLLEMDDQDVIDLMRVTEQQAQAAGEASVVSTWLMTMPADRAAVLKRKMLKKPVE